MNALIAKGWKAYKATSKGREESMLNSGAIYSSEKRANTGMMVYGAGTKKKGISSARDVQSGGSNENFLYYGKGSGAAGFMEVDPRITMYTHAFSYPSDSFGAKVSWNGPWNATKRAGSVQERLETFGHKFHKAEILVGDKIHLWSWVTRFRAPYGKRDEFIAKLKAAGIEHSGPDKIPIEEVIQE
jgi:hypothetical protein